MFDYLVVGAGFAGAVMAERLAAAAGRTVLIVDTQAATHGWLASRAIAAVHSRVTR
jgi:choline dehydrogenase-like flavoprotein